MVCRHWFETVLLEHVRVVTTGPVLLLMNNYSTHNRLIDPSGQVCVESLPPNVTARNSQLTLESSRLSKLCIDLTYCRTLAL